MAEAQWEQAQVSFEQVVQIDPGRAEAYNELGNLAMKQGQPAKAVKAYHAPLKRIRRKLITRRTRRQLRRLLPARIDALSPMSSVITIGHRTRDLAR